MFIVNCRDDKTARACVYHVRMIEKTRGNRRMWIFKNLTKGCVCMFPVFCVHRFLHINVHRVFRPFFSSQIRASLSPLHCCLCCYMSCPHDEKVTYRVREIPPRDAKRNHKYIFLVRKMTKILQFTVSGIPPCPVHVQVPSTVADRSCPL